MIRPALAAGVLGLTLAALRAPAQPAPPRAFVVRHGPDTLAVERVERGADGSVVSRLTFRGGGLPVGLRAVTTYNLAPDGRVRRATTDATAPGANAPAPRVTLTFGSAPGDSIDVQIGTAPSRRVAAAPGALPFTNLSVVPWELALRRALALGGGTLRPTDVLFYAGPQAPTLTASVAAHGRDSVVFTVNGLEILAHVTGDGHIIGMRVPAQGIDFDAADPRAVSALPTPAGPPPTSYAPPPGAPYTAEEVRVPTPAGFALAGTLTRPTAARGAVPVVVTITGSGPQDRDEHLSGIAGYALFRQIADTLGRRGIAVLRLDDRGVGASGGTFATATSRDFADDVRAALAWLRARTAERGDVDARRLALLGHSEGGLIAPMVAADDSSIAAVVLLASPAYTGQRVSEFQQRDAIAARVPAGLRTLAYQANQPGVRAQLARSPWMQFWWSYDPLPTARRVHVPVLILQGATDHQVTPEQADTLAAALRAGGNRDVTERDFPATDHLFLADPSGESTGYAALPSKSVRPEVLGAIADWVSARLAHDATP